MDEPHLPVSHIQHEFEEYQFLLPALDACVKYVHRHQVSVHIYVCNIRACLRFFLYAQLVCVG